MYFLSLVYLAQNLLARKAASRKQSVQIPSQTMSLVCTDLSNTIGLSGCCFGRSNPSLERINKLPLMLSISIRIDAGFTFLSKCCCVSQKIKGVCNLIYTLLYGSSISFSQVPYQSNKFLSNFFLKPSKMFDLMECIKIKIKQNITYPHDVEIKASISLKASTCILFQQHKKLLVFTITRCRIKLHVL